MSKARRKTVANMECQDRRQKHKRSDGACMYVLTSADRLTRANKLTRDSSTTAATKPQLPNIAPQTANDGPYARPLWSANDAKHAAMDCTTRSADNRFVSRTSAPNVMHGSCTVELTKTASRGWCYLGGSPVAPHVSQCLSASGDFAEKSVKTQPRTLSSA